MKLFKNLYYKLRHYFNKLRDYLLLIIRPVIAVSSNSYHTDGLGALLQWQLWAYSLSRLHNKKYQFINFQNVAHYKFEKLTSQEFDKKINFYFKLDKLSNGESKKILKIYDENKNGNSKSEIIKNRRSIQRNFDSNINIVYKNKYLIHIGDSLEKSKTIINNGNLSVGIHLRIFNQDDNVYDDIDTFKLFDRDSKSVDRVNNIISHIEKEYDEKNIDFYLLIQHDSKKLDDITVSKYNNSLYKIIGVDVFETISTLVEVDLLVGANSSLSYICHLLSGKKAYFNKEFRYNLYPNCKFYDDEGIVFSSR